MTIAKALGRKMLDSTRLTAMVENEIHHGELQVRKPSFIVYFMIPGLPVVAYGNVSTQRWQVSSRSKTPDDCMILGQTVVEVLEDLSQHVTISAGTDGTIDGGNSATGSYKIDFIGGDASTSTFLNTIEGGDDTFSISNISVVNMSVVKEPDSDYWHSPVDIIVAFKSSENN